jgi:hypothetical protein
MLKTPTAILKKARITIDYYTIYLYQTNTRKGLKYIQENGKEHKHERTFLAADEEKQQHAPRGPGFFFFSWGRVGMLNFCCSNVCLSSSHCVPTIFPKFVNVCPEHVPNNSSLYPKPVQRRRFTTNLF